MIQGFGEEEIDELSIFSLYIGVDFVKIGASVIIMSTIGAITDVAISITSPMREIFNHNPLISRKDLFASGIKYWERYFRIKYEYIIFRLYRWLFGIAFMV